MLKEFQPQFIKKMKEIEQQKNIKIVDFAERYLK